MVNIQSTINIKRFSYSEKKIYISSIVKPRTKSMVTFIVYFET